MDGALDGLVSAEVVCMVRKVVKVVVIPDVVERVLEVVVVVVGRG